MKRSHEDSMRVQQCGIMVMLGLLMVCGVGMPSFAAPPADPLPPPFYSFDRDSPKVLGGLLDAADILQLDPVDGIPDPAVPGEDLGLLDDTDTLDALSSDSADLASGASFVVLFSVHRQTVGVAPPDPILVERQVPYNAMDQAEKGQQAGDQYMSTVICDVVGGCILAARGLSPNNTLTRNNYDEGGTDFGADPPTSAGETARRAPQDNVDATAILEVSDPDQRVLNVYFSASADSPSLDNLPVPVDALPSGANIYFNSDPTGRADTQPFASYIQLGLQQGDDLDAMIVVDANQDRQFNPGDMVLLSLAPNSPTLFLFAAGPADIFRVLPGAFPGDPGIVDLFVSASESGLDPLNDNIDALDYTFCDLAEICAAAYAIRRLKGDFDDDGDVDMPDFVTFAGCFTGPDGSVGGGCEPGDFDGDGDIDCDDWDEFVLAWTEPGQPPQLLACASAIPAASEWGLIVMTLLGMVIGTALFSRSRSRRTSS